MASAIPNVVSGFSLAARKRRTLSVVAAAMNCIHVPFETLLGVFTMIVLMRDSVVKSYDPR